jgi:hypothetical protein
VPFTESRYPPRSDPGEIIANRDLRELYRRFISEIRRLHPDIHLEMNHMEIWVRIEEAVLARIVTYRELFHVQIGQEDVWEIRVRNRAACLETLDRLLARFLQVYSRHLSGRPG